MGLKKDGSKSRPRKRRSTGRGRNKEGFRRKIAEIPIVSGSFNL